MTVFQITYAVTGTPFPVYWKIFGTAEGAEHFIKTVRKNQDAMKLLGITDIFYIERHVEL